MSVTVTFYRNNSDKRRVEKDLTQMFEKSLDLKGDVDVANPIFIITGDVSDYAAVNYMHVGDFGRLYFLDPPRALPGGLVEVSGHVDILSTVAMGLWNATGIIDRQETYYNLYLNDGSFQAQCNDKVVTKEFSAGFSTPNFVLILAG